MRKVKIQRATTISPEMVKKIFDYCEGKEELRDYREYARVHALGNRRKRRMVIARLLAFAEAYKEELSCQR